MVITKRELIKISVISVIGIAALIFLLIGCTKSVNASVQPQTYLPVIVIDPGHGGEDGGAVAPDGTNEKDINLGIAKQLDTICRYSGIKTIMTRKSDIAIYDVGKDTLRSKKVSDMKNRLKIFNQDKNSIAVSIHQNKFEKEKYSGSQLFFSANNPKSEMLAECIRLSVTGMMQPDNKREKKAATKDIYLLYNCNQHSVIVECGFLSNNAELEKLKSKEYQKKIAFSVYCGCLEYINRVNSDYQPLK